MLLRTSGWAAVGLTLMLPPIVAALLVELLGDGFFEGRRDLSEALLCHGFRLLSRGVGRIGLGRSL